MLNSAGFGALAKRHIHFQSRNVIITVQDDGPGDAPEHQSRIFDRFYRADKSRTDRAHSGLGLSIAKKVVNDHGGELTYETAEPHPWETDLVALVCDEDGLSKPEQEWNRYIDDYHFIRGSFFICGLGEEDFCDIPADLAQKYAEMFWFPESFISIDGNLVVIREDDGSTAHV